MTRLEIVTEARAWIGTPYCHRASVKGAGADCLGLVRGVWRKLYGQEPATLPVYGRSWAQNSGDEILLNAAEIYLWPTREPAPGDVLVFRMHPRRPCSHMGIVSGPDHFIHAAEGRAVSETRLELFWQKRIAAVFSFPEIG